MFPTPQTRPANRPAHPERNVVMTTPQPSPSAQLPAPPALARPGNGLGVAALVLGVASLGAAAGGIAVRRCLVGAAAPRGRA